MLTALQLQAIVNGLRESVLTFERDVGDVTSRDVIVSPASLVPDPPCCCIASWFLKA